MDSAGLHWRVHWSPPDSSRDISKMWESFFGLANSTMFGSDGQTKYDHVMFTPAYQSISIHCKGGNTLSILLPAWPTITINMSNWYVITVRIPDLAHLDKLFTSLAYCRNQYVKLICYYQSFASLTYYYSKYVKLICYYRKNTGLDSAWQVIQLVFKGPVRSGFRPQN